MFKATTRTHSGRATVAYHTEPGTGALVVTSWDLITDRVTELERFEVNGTVADTQAARAMVRGFIATYATLN